MSDMPDPNAFDEPRFEDSLRDDPVIPVESRYVQDVYELYVLLERNAAYAIRSAEADAERDEIMRELDNLESFSFA